MVSESTPNKIGMDGNAWLECFNCSAPYACTNSYWNDSRPSLGDQLLEYENNTLASRAFGDDAACTFLSGLPFSFASPLANICVQTIGCNFTKGTLSLDLSLGGKNVGLSVVPQVPKMEISTLTGTWTPIISIITTAKNVGYRYGNFSVIVKQCCFERQKPFAYQCYSSLNSSFEYYNSPAWSVVGITGLAIFSTDIYFPLHSPLVDLPKSKSYSCDMEITEANNLTTTNYYYVSNNVYLGLNATETTIAPTQANSDTLSALSFFITFDIGLLSIDFDILVAR